MAKYGLTTYRDYIYVYYHHQNQRFTISTRFRSEELFDPVTKSLVPKHDEYFQAKRVTDNITNNMITAALRVQTAGYEPTAHLVREEYYKVLESADPIPKKSAPLYPDFYQMWHEFMKVKAAEMQPDGFRSYTQLYGLLREFEAFDDYEMDFHTFDLVMFGRLKQYMFLVKKYADATTQKLVKKLRAFYRWSVPTLDISFLKFTPVNVMNINPLEEGELEYLASVGLPEKGYMDKARDLFVFCCCTGMRYRDSQRFDESWIRDGLIEYTQSKTAQEAMVPMLDMAYKILVKWGSNTPKMEVQPYNRHLKELFEHLEFNRQVKVYTATAGRKEVTMVPFWSQVGSHTARKTFITYALARGVPIQDVMKMSGHHDYQTIKPYIAISKDHIKQQGGKFGL